MLNNFLIVIDMQNDFINGSLGTKEAEGIMPNVIKKINDFQGNLIFTLDTHENDYLNTKEGSLLPVEHCIKNTTGWKLTKELELIQLEKKSPIYEKPTFGSVKLAQDLVNIHNNNPITSIELIGVCTDICVVSNALLIKAYLPEVNIIVDESCCAGTNIENHKAAIKTMKNCQITIK